MSVAGTPVDVRLRLRLLAVRVVLAGADVIDVALRVVVYRCRDTRGRDGRGVHQTPSLIVTESHPPPERLSGSPPTRI